MSERKKNLLALALMLGIMLLFFNRILFTDKIIRAPDIINEYYWTVLHTVKQPLLDMFSINLSADWDIYSNSGNTLEGGGQGNQFLVWQKLIYHLIPPPASVAWFIVLHFFVGSAGVYACCRVVGASRGASVIGGLVFALAPEMVSLINAGHVLKIATISLAPWGFCLLEKGFQTRRAFWFMSAAVVLALQFFYTHWQIAYYTCLCIGLYGVLRFIGAAAAERDGKRIGRLFCLNLLVLCFFLSTVAIDLFPLANWSTETNRGARSGANQGKGGLDREEAMLWSMPPEEVAAFVVPGMFGFSRQEGGENPPDITTYYWGRMVFTQTISYFGLLPLLMLPLPLIFRRDRYTWLAVAGIAGCLLFSMGKYTPFYNWLFDHFPGINRFRVPKMIMFIPVIGLGVMTARGIDILRDETVRNTRAFRRYLAGICLLPILLLAVMAGAYVWRSSLSTMFIEQLSQPTRYEQGAYLVTGRWMNLIAETGIAAVVAGVSAIVMVVCLRRHGAVRWMPLLLFTVYLADVGRVGSKFMFLVEVPRESRQEFRTPVIDFLAGQPKEYRVLPLTGPPGPYSSNRIPVMFTPMPVQQRRWQEFLDTLSLTSVMPDIMNVRYLVMGAAEYEKDRAQLAAKYSPAFVSPDRGEVVLENRSVLPKAWLVPSVAYLKEPSDALSILQNPSFDPRKVALVEVPPRLAMTPSLQAGYLPPESVKVDAYSGGDIRITARVRQNALLVLGEKYYRGWKATVDGAPATIERVNYLLRGLYLTPGSHTVEFRFDPLPFKIGKWLTLCSFALFAVMARRERLTGAGSVSGPDGSPEL